MELRILLAPDKFKGSLSGAEICNILKAEILNVLPNAQVESCPLADGGDGSLEVLSSYLQFEKHICNTVDPIGRSIEAEYYTFGKTAYIELASASGVVLLEEAECNPMYTSTYGTGIQILDAIKSGAEHIYLFLGGSATNDGGVGIASALGYIFYDEQGNVLEPIGSALNKITSISAPVEVLSDCEFTLCCDVENPPFGPNGAAFVYAKQKGASEQEIIDLDNGIANLCSQLERYSGIDLSLLVGGGAAGGVALSLSAFFGAAIVSGMELISKTTMLESKIVNSDLVISGEGRLDTQSLNGKVVSGVAEMCKLHGKRLWLVVGRNDLINSELKILEVENLYSIIARAAGQHDAIANSKNYLKDIGHEIVEDLRNLG